jgi:hypothetical protein
MPSKTWNKDMTLTDWQRLNPGLVASKLKKETKEPEKLSVEFLVEKTMTKEFGYEEKFLLHKGKDLDAPPHKIPYKAILQNDQFASIVGRQYKLIPNEEVIEKVKEISIAKKLTYTQSNYNWRVYLALMDEERNVGILVSNSVDGTLALRVDAIVKFSHDSFSIIVGGHRKVKNIYRRHTDNLTTASLSAEITGVYENAKEFKVALEGLDTYKLSEYKEPLKEILGKELPEVYTAGIFNNYTSIGSKPQTVRTVYEEISRRIWKKDNDVKTKLSLYKKLNDAIASVAALDVL